MTRRLPEDTLVNKTTEELVTYLRSGTVNTDTLASSLDYDGLEIDDWDRLKRIHFCLSDDVHNFVTELPNRVRRIKTEHQREDLQTQGEVRGAIDWNSTLRTRSESGYADRTKFICNTPYTEYDIPENRVLNRLLWQLHRTTTEELAPVDYDWRHDHWTDDQLSRFDRLYTQNVHLNRIPDGKTITVTGQDMTTARRSRLTLYNDAYSLYDQYQRLQADTYDPEITELLTNTLIIPASTPTLFELYCIFRLTRLLNQSTPEFYLQPIDGSTDALAQLETADQRIEIYHDSTGTLHFHEPLDPDNEPTHETFKRYQNALIDYSDALKDLTGTDRDPVLYNGRPDIIIEHYDTTGTTDQLQSALIGEIKHSDSTQTFKQGLKELTTYRRFAKHDEYLIDNPDVSLTSLLITNGFTTTDTSDHVTHINGSDLLNNDTPLTLQHTLNKNLKRKSD